MMIVATAVEILRDALEESGDRPIEAWTRQFALDEDPASREHHQLSIHGFEVDSEALILHAWPEGGGETYTTRTLLETIESLGDDVRELCLEVAIERESCEAGFALSISPVFGRLKSATLDDCVILTGLAEEWAPLLPGARPGESGA